MSDEEITSRLGDLFSGDVPEPEEVSPPAEGSTPEGQDRQTPPPLKPEGDDRSGSPALSTLDLFSSGLEEITDEQSRPSREDEARLPLPVEYEEKSGPVREESVLPPRPLSTSQRPWGIAGALARLWEPHAAPSGEARKRLEEGRDRILNLLLGGAAVGGGLASLALIVNIIQKPEKFVSYSPFLLGYALVLVVFLARRIPRVWRITVLIGVSYLVALFSVYENGPISTAPWYLIAIPLLFFILVGERAGIISAVINVLLYVLLAVAYHRGWREVEINIDLATSVSQTLVVSVSFALISGIVVVVQTLFARTQRLVRLALEEQSAVLQEAHATSAQRQQELERANLVLRRQTQHFELSVQIGRVAAMGLDTGEFATRAVQLIQERIGAYYVGLLLLDRERAVAQLEAVAGMPWRALTSRQQRLIVADELLLRQCVSSGRVRILLGIDHVQGLAAGLPDAMREGQFLLPETQSALALPLIARGEVFGVISIQSRSPAGFKNEDMVSLRTVADQVATAISNSRLAQELQGRLHELEVLQRYYVRQAWDEFLSSREDRLYEYHLPGMPALEDVSLPEVERVLHEPQLTVLSGPAVLDGTHSALVSPISLREQILGVLGFHHAEEGQTWTADQIELVEAITEQMGLIIENARLFADAQFRAARERRAREITARMRESLDVEGVLQTTVREMGETLQLRDVTIRLAEQQSYAAQGESAGTDR